MRDVPARIRLFAKPIPFFCLFITSLTVAGLVHELALSSNGVISPYLWNDPLRFVRDVELWRVFTTCLTHINFSDVLLSSYLLLMEGAALENRIGTVAYGSLFLVKSVLVGTTYLVWYYVFYAIGTISESAIAAGAWMTVLSDLLSRSIVSPKELRIFRLMSNATYSLIVVFIAVCMSISRDNASPVIEILAVTSIAVLEAKGFNGLIVRLFMKDVQKFERLCVVRQLRRLCFFGFVSVDECNPAFFKETDETSIFKRISSDIEEQEMTIPKGGNEEEEEERSRAPQITSKDNCDDQSFYG